MLWHYGKHSSNKCRLKLTVNKILFFLIAFRLYRMLAKNLKIFLVTLCVGGICCNFVPLDDTWEISLAYWFDYNHHLVGHVIESLNVFLAECIEACQKTFLCFSINYSQFPNGSYLCELSRSTKTQSIESYKDKTGYQYGEAPVKYYKKTCLILSFQPSKRLFPSLESKTLNTKQYIF